MESHYKKLGIAISINAVIMFFLTYALINEMGHFYVNINKAYMALMMAAPMVIVMLIVMRSMYRDTQLNTILYTAFAGLFVVSFWLARTQTPVGNEQFLRSMIPHHSSAILMCGQAQITDPEIVELCGQIVRAQKEEIMQMKTIMQRY